MDIYTDWADLRGDERLDSREIQSKYDELLYELEEDEREPDEDEQAFIDEVKELEVELSEWHHGAELIREDCFEDYAQELAKQLGDINSDVSWPYTCIDWERAARELAMDYHSVSFLGNDYLTRSY